MQDPNTHSVKKNADLAIQNMRITMFRVNTFCKPKTNNKPENDDIDEYCIFIYRLVPESVVESFRNGF